MSMLDLRDIKFTSDGEGLENSPFHKLMYDVMMLIEDEIGQAYLDGIIDQDKYDYGDVLSNVLANSFVNIIQKRLVSQNIKERIEIFDNTLRHFSESAQQLFLSLHTLSANESYKN